MGDAVTEPAMHLEDETHLCVPKSQHWFCVGKNFLAIRSVKQQSSAAVLGRVSEALYCWMITMWWGPVGGGDLER